MTLKASVLEFVKSVSLVSSDPPRQRVTRQAFQDREQLSPLLSRRQEEVRIVMVGAFPPPLHGMAAVNAAVYASLRHRGVTPTVINVAGSSLNRSLGIRLSRIPRVVLGLFALAFRRSVKGATLYMSVSGGLGQIYEGLFCLIARIRGLRLFLHHHSFAYLDTPTQLMNSLTRVAGASTVHIVQSPGMAARLKNTYEAKLVVPVSNSVFLVRPNGPQAQPRRMLRTVGFLSNICRSKGIFECLDLFEKLEAADVALAALIAGPFEDAGTERGVRAKLAELPRVTYVGPKYHADKDAFFTEIDVLIFPTRYRNETEGIVNFEAMSRGVPVIAYGRGCIPEIMVGGCGKVIDPAMPFVPAAYAQLTFWMNDQAAFHRASRMAIRRFGELAAANEARWLTQLDELTCSNATNGGRPLA